MDGAIIRHAEKAVKRMTKRFIRSRSLFAFQEHVREPEDGLAGFALRVGLF